jgi:hypothetical protein
MPPGKGPGELNMIILVPKTKTRAQGDEVIADYIIYKNTKMLL